MYDQYYELTGRPFQLTPDPRFYFESATHRKALSYLGYGLAQGEGFIVITGEIGAGKTTLVRHLMETVDPARLTAANIVTTQIEGKDLLQMVAESFGIAARSPSKSDLLAAIEQFLHAEARAGRRCLLVVDEAQNLPTETLEELRMLSNFQLGSQALLQIFLLGQPEFRDQLKGSDRLEQLRQRVIATHHLEAMQPGEIEDYIAHRLSKCGWNGRPDFSADAIAQIYAASGGVPRKLNMLMTRILLMGAVEHTDSIDGGLVARVVADIDGIAPQMSQEDDQVMADEPAAAEAGQAPGAPALVAIDGPAGMDEIAAAAPADEPVVDTAPPPAAEPEPESEPQAEPEPVPQVEPEPESQAEPEPIPELVAAPEPEPTPTPEPADIEQDRPVRFFRPGIAPPVFESVPEAAAPAQEEDLHADAAMAARPPIDEAAFAALLGRVDILDKRVDEQEATTRRLVAMLLDYVERDDALIHRRAA